MLEHDAHREITGAGWAYRTNNRGWVIYRDPRTRLWHTRTDAMSIVEALVSRQVGPLLDQIPGVNTVAPAMAAPAPDSSASLPPPASTLKGMRHPVGPFAGSC
jgi:hypothetical protein